MKKSILLNFNTLLFNHIPVEMLIKMEGVMTNLRHGDVAGAFLALLNVICDNHRLEYPYDEHSLGISQKLNWLGNLILSSLIALTILFTNT